MGLSIYLKQIGYARASQVYIYIDMNYTDSKNLASRIQLTVNPNEFCRLY